jgi:uncharacterized protein involved in exopolysaccharide biosynthesis
MESEEQAAGLPSFLRDPIGATRRRWVWMAAAASIGVVATIIYVTTIPITYLAQTTVLVTSQQIPKQFVTSTVTEDALDRINALIGELLSRGRLISIIERHDPYPELAEFEPGALVALLKNSVSVTTQAGMGRGRRNDSGGSVIFNITYRHHDPEMAAAIANDLASLFVAASSRLRGQQARITTEFMQTELNRSERELREMDRQIADFKARHRGELPTELQSNLAKLDRLATERQNIGDQIRSSEALVSATLGGIDTSSTNSPYARLQALQANLAIESAVNTDEHPNVLALRRQIEAIEQEIAQGGVGAANQDPIRQQSVAPQRRLISEMRLRLARIDQEVTDLEGRVARTPEIQEELNGMEERALVVRESYVSSLRKVQAAELAESLEVAQQGERVQVVDRALPPSEPEKRRAKYLFLGLAASLGLAAGIAMLLEIIDPVIVSRAQIEQDLGLPVLGGVPEIG